jgi:hypothetical protein
MDDLDQVGLSICISSYAILLGLAALIMEHERFLHTQRPRQRRWWTKPLLAKRDREGTMKIVMTKLPSDGFFIVST